MSTEEAFTQLGLSRYEAEAYMALLNAGSSDAKALASSTRVPFSKIYSTLKSLTRVGLVKVSRTRPQIYYPMSPDEAVAHLRRRATEKQEKLLKGIVDELMPLYNQTRVSERAEIEIIHDIDVATRRVLNVVKEAKAGVRAIIPDVPAAQFEQLTFLVEGLSRVGINLKILTTVENLKLLTPRGFFAEMKVLAGSPIGLLISDLREVFAVYLDDGRFYALFTQSDFLVNLAIILFERLWNLAEEPATL